MYMYLLPYRVYKSYPSWRYPEGIMSNVIYRRRYGEIELFRGTYLRTRA